MAAAQNGKKFAVLFATFTGPRVRRPCTGVVISAAALALTRCGDGNPEPISEVEFGPAETIDLDRRNRYLLVTDLARPAAETDIPVILEFERAGPYDVVFVDVVAP